MMTPADIRFIAELVKRRAGIVLSDQKGYLIESRLAPVIQRARLSNAAALIALLRANNEHLAREVTEAMTTNETFFFRDPKVFETFRNHVLPAILAQCQARRTFRIWCAAAATGQEPYTLAMLLHEHAAAMPGWRWEILATDISERALSRAIAGVYSAFEVQRGLPERLLAKYFIAGNGEWQLRPEIRASVRFRPHNLLDSLALLGSFEAVFCRNVLIYFDQETKSRTLAGIRRLMGDDGFLVLGGAETTMGLSDEFRPVEGQAGLYRTAPLAQPAAGLRAAAGR